jgi:hypothetical protein
MDNENIVSINWVFSKLNLSNAPRRLAYSSITSLVQSNELTLYFDDPVYGASSKDGYEITTDGNGEVTGALINGGHGELHSEQKKVISFTAVKNNGDFILSVGEYEFNNEKFYPTDETSMWIDFIYLDEEQFYLDKQEVLSISTDDFSSASASKYPSKPAGEPGVRKALALLARDKAESPAFQKGHAVNASAFKDHILRLAKKYITDEGSRKRDHGLNSLDDKINTTLDDLDIKNIK